MDQRLLKRWAITKNLLSDAALQIEGSAQFVEYNEFMSHNELGLALETLADAGEHQKVNAEYWRLLKKAAEVMGLNEQVKELRCKFQVARTRDGQPSGSTD